MTAAPRAGSARGPSVFGASPWRRAPVLLLRRPGVFLAIVGAAAVLSIAAASGVLFLSTLGTASLQAQAASACPEYSLPTVSASVSGTRVAATTAAGVAAFRAHGLPTPVVSDVGSAQIQDSQIHLFAKPGALDQVDKLTPDTGASGAWFPDVFAEKIGAHVGDAVPTTGGRSITVAGIYRDMAPDPYALAHVPHYFCSWQTQIVATVASDQAIAATPINSRQGPFLITDPATVAATSDVAVLVNWNAPLAHDAVSLTGFDRGQREAAAAAAQLSAGSKISATLSDQLATKSAIAHRAQDGVAGSILPIDLAGVFVAGLLVAGAGVFWTTHRSREIRLLVARGVSPPALGIKAILETAPAALIGLVAGYLGALELVRAVGPSSVFEPGTPVQGLLVALASVAAGIVVIGLIGARAGRDRTFGAGRGRLAKVPWELLLLAVAVWLGLRIRSESGVTVTRTVVSVSPLTFLFPILGSTAVLLLVGRAVYWLLPVIGRSGRALGTAGYLALRRLAGSGVVVIGLIIGTALPCCLLTYGSTVTKGVNDEVTQKYRTNLGADHVLAVYGIYATNPDAKGHATVVSIYQTAPSLPDGEAAYVLGVDPTTFARFAFLTGAQRSDLNRLHAVAADERVPAILVNAAGGTAAGSVSIGASTIPLDVVARSAVFPGLRNGSRPMVVVERTALAHVDVNADRLNQAWTSNAQLNAARSVFNTRPYSVLTEVTSDVVIGTTGLLPVTWIFGYLRALAVPIGVVAIAGLVFALAARTRQRTVSYVMSRRMGLGRFTHLRSLLVELTLVVGFGWAAGSGVGAAAFAFIFGGLDVYPALPPPASFVVPTPTLILTALVTLAVIAAASLATHVLAERANPADILRLE